MRLRVLVLVLVLVLDLVIALVLVPRVRDGGLRTVDRDARM